MIHYAQRIADMRCYARAAPLHMLKARAARGSGSGAVAS